MLFPVLNVLCFYISTVLAALCVQCPIWLLSVVLWYRALQVCCSDFLNDLEMVPIVLIITGITFLLHGTCDVFHHHHHHHLLLLIIIIIIYTGCFKKSFTTLKAYRNLYRGHTQRFELSKCSKTHRVLPRDSYGSM